MSTTSQLASLEINQAVQLCLRNLVQEEMDRGAERMLLEESLLPKAMETVKNNPSLINPLEALAILPGLAEAVAWLNPTPEQITYLERLEQERLDSLIAQSRERSSPRLFYGPNNKVSTEPEYLQRYVRLVTKIESSTLLGRV